MKTPKPEELAIVREVEKKYKDTKIRLCQICSQDTEHTVMDKQRDEIYTCQKCGGRHAVRVR